MMTVQVSRCFRVTAFPLLGALACGTAGERASDSAVRDTPATARPETAPVDSVNWQRVDSVMGRGGTSQASGVYRYNFPRGDLRVTADGITIKPAFALGGWVAMKATSSGVVAMGDLVLTGDELTPVISSLQSGGIEQTAIHHHIVRESPRIYYVHIHAHGDPLKIAESVKAAVALSKAPPPAPPSPATSEIGIDTAQIAQTLGTSGRVNGGVYQVNVPRSETIRDGTFEIPATMGLGTVMNFQPTSQGRAAITGDFVLLAAEVNPVIRALRDNAIEVTSLHSHLLSEEPRLFFMHFWAHDDALKLARGLRQALDKTNSTRPTM